MKKTTKALAAALSAAILLCSCSMSDKFKTKEWQLAKETSFTNLTNKELWKLYRGDYSQYENMSDDEFWSAVFMAEIYPNALENKVITSNTIAFSAANIAEQTLVATDVAGSGMKFNYGSMQIFDIIVKDGVWSCNAADTNNFKENGDPGLRLYEWGTAGTADITTEKKELSGAEGLMCYELCQAFPDIKNASFKFYLRAGRCLSTIYIDGRTSAVTYGDNCPDVDEDGYFESSYEWNGEIAGVNSNGEFVGTYPAVPIK